MRSTLNIKGQDDSFEVNTIYCIGKNYEAHINEFVNPEIPKSPVVFLKPNAAIRPNGSKISVPLYENKPISEDLQNEVEVVIAIGKDGYRISEENSQEHIFGYAIGLDLTLRDLQAEDKKKGLPWTVAKGFYGAAPVSDIVLKEKIKDIQNINFGLDVNGKRQQYSNTDKMLFNVNKIISYISHIFSISKGDLIFTGSPEGISTLLPGYKLKAFIENEVELEVEVTNG